MHAKTLILLNETTKTKNVYNGCKSTYIGKSETCIFSGVFFFFNMVGTKTLKTWKIPYLAIQNSIKKFIFRVFLILLCTQILKCMHNTLYGETEQNFQKRVF